MKRNGMTIRSLIYSIGFANMPRTPGYSPFNAVIISRVSFLLQVDNSNDNDFENNFITMNYIDQIACDIQP